MVLSLKMVTFVIPIKCDSNDRIFNLELIIDYLRKNFDTNIIVGEAETSIPGRLQGKCDSYIKYYIPKFHRAYILNQMYKEVKTPIICNYDADVLFEKEKYLDSANLILHDGYDIVYPYSGRFMDVSKVHHKRIRDELDITFLVNIEHNVRHHNSLGGAYFFNSNLLYKGIMENEKFKSWGCEDRERYYRYSILGFKIKRVPGDLYHLVHYRDKSCYINSPGCKEGEKEFNKVSHMNKEEILSYMYTWECMQQ